MLEKNNSKKGICFFFFLFIGEKYQKNIYRKSSEIFLKSVSETKFFLKKIVLKIFLMTTFLISLQFYDFMKRNIYENTIRSTNF